MFVKLFAQGYYKKKNNEHLQNVQVQRWWLGLIVYRYASREDDLHESILNKNEQKENEKVEEEKKDESKDDAKADENEESKDDFDDFVEESIPLDMWGAIPEAAKQFGMGATPGGPGSGPEAPGARQNGGLAYGNDKNNNNNDVLAYGDDNNNNNDDDEPSLLDGGGTTTGGGPNDEDDYGYVGFGDFNDPRYMQHHYMNQQIQYMAMLKKMRAEQKKILKQIETQNRKQSINSEESNKVEEVRKTKNGKKRDGGGCCGFRKKKMNVWLGWDVSKNTTILMRMYLFIDQFTPDWLEKYEINCTVYNSYMMSEIIIESLPQLICMFVCFCC